MSDDERRLRDVLRDGVPEPPGSPAYGARVEAVARCRRTARRGAVVGGAALAAAAVVAVVAATAGGPAPKTDKPVASAPVPASISCNVSATVEGLQTDVTVVRLCIASPAYSGPTPRVPGDALAGAAAGEFARTIRNLPRVGSPPCPPGTGPAYRLVFGYADASSASVHIDASGCSLLTIKGEVQHRAGTGVVDTYLRLLHVQREQLGPPDEPPPVSCPSRADLWGSTLGADIPSPGEDGLGVVLCRYDRETAHLRVAFGPGSDPQVAALANSTSRDPCTTIRVKPPRYDDRVLLVDAYGDVVVAPAFFCTPHDVDGQNVWPDLRLQGVVNRLFRSTDPFTVPRTGG